MTVVAIVPAKDRADRVAATVSALLEIRRVDRVIVVDDGSTDDTCDVARRAGAEVLRLPANLGKAGAVRSAVELAPEAEVFVLVDADLSETAAAADALIEPLLNGEADMTVGVLPDAMGRGGLGLVKGAARWGTRRASGFDPVAPLSGQRAVRAEILRGLSDAERFGLEVALNVDAARDGATILEVAVPMDHLHTGRSLKGFVHRGRQGIDVARALWPRLVSRLARRVLAVALTLAALVAGLVVASGWEPTSSAAAPGPRKVVLFGLSPVGFDDIGTGAAPTFERLVSEEGLAAMSARTIARGPTTTEGWLSVGAGARASRTTTANVAYPIDADLGSGTAGEVMESLSGLPPTGDIVVPGGPSVLRRNDTPQVPSAPGSLGTALHEAGLTTAVVGNADRPSGLGLPGLSPQLSRPAVLALMDDSFAVDTGSVDPDRLLMADPSAPYGVRADPDAMLEEFVAAYESADVVVVDPGDLDRADSFRHVASPLATETSRLRALAHSDEILERVLQEIDDDTLVIVASIAPPRGRFELTPVVALGPGVPEGWLHSPSVRRPGLIAITDLAPTILAATGAEIPSEMIGNPLRYRSGEPSLGPLREYNQDTLYRERTYYPQAVGFIVFQGILYLLATLILRSGRLGERAHRLLRYLVVAAASYPLATFIAKAVPGFSGLGGLGPYVTVAIAAAVAALACRARRTPLSPLTWVMAATAALIVLDAATGTWLHVSSWLGYSLHSAGRFYGIPNTTFAVLAACTLLWAGAHVHYASRRRDAVFTASLVLIVVAVADGAPQLGGDVGGILTLVPVFALTVVALSGWRLSWRWILAAGLVTVALLAGAALVDMLRPEESQTHLGRFADDVLNDGAGPAVEAFLRKQGANLRILQVSIWTWMIPIAAGFVLYLLGVERRFRDLLPTGGALRLAVVATTAAALLGFATNDSGPIVIALFYVYVGPFLTLLALAGDRGAPILLPPTDDLDAGAGVLDHAVEVTT